MKNKKTKKQMSNSENNKIDNKNINALQDILSLTASFCKKHLNEEYWNLCIDLASALYDMDMPLEKGKPQGWASGIVHALGLVNFLGDSSFAPYMKSSQIAEEFGVSQQTMQTKSKIIRDELDMMPMDPEWCLESLLADNPLVWMFETANGFIADIRTAPREVQEQAYKEGLIPYIPADHQEPEKLEKESENNIKIIEFPSGKNRKTESESTYEQKDSNPTLFDKSKE
jgi:hypothetical protein